jgi:tripartite-type tricarboxylate transporter receptor subunit TctC
MLSRRTLIAALLGLPGLCGMLLPAAAQDYPNRPIRLISPFPPGGGTDTFARLLGDRLAPLIGVAVVVENRSGAGGNIGLDAVAKSQPDGYTLGLAQTSNLAINPSLYAKMPYDSLRDLAPIGLVAGGPVVLVVNASAPYRTLDDIIAAARAKPGMLTMGSPGTGTVGHLVGEMLQMAAKVKVQHVPYRGASPAITDLLGGRIDFYFSTVPPALAQIQGKLLRGLAVTSQMRIRDLPDVPTVEELGYPGFYATSWYGLVARAGTPAPIIERLSVETRKALDSAAVREKFAVEGVEVMSSTPQEFRALLEREIARWGEIVRESGAKVE